MKRNRTLKVLNLSENKIDVQGLWFLAEALVSKYSTPIPGLTVDLLEIQLYARFARSLPTCFRLEVNRITLLSIQTRRSAVLKHAANLIYTHSTRLTLRIATDSLLATRYVSATAVALATLEDVAPSAIF